MCPSCFIEQIYNFETYERFEEFDLKLSKRTSNGKLKPIKKDGILYANEYFECMDCKDIWVLSLPENAWRGFFLTETRATEHVEQITKQDKRKKIGCFITLILIVGLVLILVS